MPISHRVHLQSDIVRDSKLETKIFSSYTQHIIYKPGPTARHRRLRKEERWVRDRLLGQGAYGTVYLERCEKGNNSIKLRAVKEVRKFIVAGEELDYTRELEAISKFSHPKYSHCFVRSGGWFETPELVYIVMEYFENGDLQKYLTRPLPEVEARTITLQILEGLTFMHDNGFVHRDLKPGNIMVVSTGPDWYVKIADFGISKRRQHDVTSLRTIHRGTLGYAAPEAIGCMPDNELQSYTASVDMWSLGAVIYKILTNSTPFSNYFALLQYTTGELNFPTENLLERSVTGQVQQFIVALMSPDPIMRLDTAAANKHPWIVTPLPLVTQCVEVRETSTILAETTVASASWSSAPEQTRTRTVELIQEQDVKQVKRTEKATEVLTVKHVENIIDTRSYSLCRAPFVDDCDDKPGETCGGSLSQDSPYVLDDAGSTRISPPKELHSSSRPALYTGENISGVSFGAIYENTARSNSDIFPRSSQAGIDSEESNILYEIFGQHEGLMPRPQRPKSPISQEVPVPLSPSRSSMVVDISSDYEDRIINESSSSSATEEEFEGASDMYDSFTDGEDGFDNDPAPLYNELQSYRNSWRILGDIPGGSKYHRQMRKRCVYCSIEHSIVYGMIEALECTHWACHYCLMERFALELVSGESVLQCCSQNITFQHLGRIIIDPAVNQLCSGGYFRENRKAGPEDDFLIFLSARGVFRDPWVIGMLEVLTSLKLSGTGVGTGAEDDKFPIRKLDHPIGYMEFKQMGPSDIRVKEEEDVITHLDGDPGRSERHGIPFIETWRWHNTVDPNSWLYLL